MVTSHEIGANPVPIRDRRREVTVRTHVAIAPNLILSLPVIANPTDSIIGGWLGTAVAQALVLPGADDQNLDNARFIQILPGIIFS
jgi:hypothetical protein